MKKLVLSLLFLLKFITVYANSKNLNIFIIINHKLDSTQLLVVKSDLDNFVRNNSLIDITNYTSNSKIGIVTPASFNNFNYNTYIKANNYLIIKLPSYWVKQTLLTANMPYGIEIYKSTTNYSYKSGPIRKMKAFCIVVDPKYIDFKPTYATPNKLPVNFIKDEPGTVLACMNAGFFGPNLAYSMLRYNGSNYTNNIASFNRTYNDDSVVYYATRAAFGLTKDLKPEVAWIYPVSGVVYSYAVPSPNNIKNPPQPQPTEVCGAVWNVISAVGGAPMLIKNGSINITDTEELIVIDNKSPRARTAIGYTAHGKIIMLTVEGENKGVSDGLTLIELANYMKDIGCVGAINLDGGSSTMLRVGCKEVIKPSSSGLERAMPGVILLKSKK